jgi:LL-diaminopimelate aminotransferase
MTDRFGVTGLDAQKEVCSGVGSKELLANMFRGLITPKDDPNNKDVIMVPDPGYASYADAISTAGGRAYSINLNKEDNYAPSLEDEWNKAIASGIKAKNIKAVVINYPSNPIGATAPDGYLAECVEFAKKHDILLISDAAYADLAFDGADKPQSILEIPGAKDVAIEMHSLSKPYCLTGWRVAFAVGNAQAIKLLSTVKSTVDSGLPKPIQYAAGKLLNSNAGNEHIKLVNSIYANNQECFVDGLRSLGWDEKLLNKPNATFYVWLPVPKIYKNKEESASKAFADDLLLTAGIAVVPGTAFGQNGEGFVRLSLVLPKQEMVDALHRMSYYGFNYKMKTRPEHRVTEKKNQLRFSVVSLVRRQQLTHWEYR